MAGWPVASPAQTAQTAGWPNKPIRIIVGYPPGGAVDIAARAIADKLSDSLKQPIVIESKPGASGVIGTDYVAKSAPDGYTLLMAASTIPIQATLLKLPFDTVRDITQIAMVATTPLVLVVNPKLPVNDVAGLIALAKAQPGKLNYGNPSRGSSNHLATEMFKSMAGLDIVNVPYKGGPQAETDLIGGVVTMMFGAAPSTLPQVKSGRMKALAVSTSARAGVSPDLPTMAESGLPGFDVTNWYGLMGPANMPPAIVQRLNAEVNRALLLPEVRERLQRAALDPAPQTPEQFSTFVRTEIVKWAKVIKDTGTTAD
ncbi:tripartite tricarboxylate transporter substrate binding protein [Ramlibacter sp.]|uniref:tripartite tricarboxylate transporter substrate binding protein n=1 Tax=Ramlibacter sp. TaxID=1917967 RepID=UPI003D0BA25F